MSFFCFLLSLFSIAFVFCILLSAFLVVIAVHVCYGGRGGLAGASIDLIWAFSASGFDTLTCLFIWYIWHSAYLWRFYWPYMGFASSSSGWHTRFCCFLQFGIISVLTKIERLYEIFYSRIHKTKKSWTNERRTRRPGARLIYRLWSQSNNMWMLNLWMRMLNS